MDMKIDCRVMARELIASVSEPAAAIRMEDDSPTLADLGYDSLSVVELVIEVQAELDDRGITTDLDDEMWSTQSLVADVEADIAVLLKGRDLA